MNIRVITPPEPFITPADIAGNHQPNDAKIAAMIAAAVEEIDGYSGWLGRCLAPQELEYEGWLSGGCGAAPLPIGPVLEISSVSYKGPAGTEVTVDPSTFWIKGDRLVFGPQSTWLFSSCLTLRYWAGYGVRNATDPTKWDEKVPVRVKQAIIMSVQHMKSISAENLFLRSEEVEGVGTVQYTVSDQAGAIIRDTSRALLSGLKVRRV